MVAATASLVALGLGRARDQQPRPGQRAEQQAGEGRRIVDAQDAGLVGGLERRDRRRERISLV